MDSKYYMSTWACTKYIWTCLNFQVYFKYFSPSYTRKLRQMNVIAPTSLSVCNINKIKVKGWEKNMFRLYTVIYKSIHYCSSLNLPHPPWYICDFAHHLACAILTMNHILVKPQTSNYSGGIESNEYCDRSLLEQIP